MAGTTSSDYLPENGDLITDACAVLAKEGRLTAYPYHGFWHPADTVKERVALEAMYQAGQAHWMPWREGPDSPAVLRVAGH